MFIQMVPSVLLSICCFVNFSCLRLINPTQSNDRNVFIIILKQELDQIGLETIEKNMRIEQLINDISTNHTKTSETLDQETARLQEQISENETQLKHFIRIAVKMGKTLPKEIESLKKQVESLGAYF